MKRIRPTDSEPAQAMQRVRVGLAGLMTVSLAVLLASLLLHSAHREPPVVAVGAPNANVVADIAQGGNNSSDKSAAPLAELGVEPDTPDTQSGNQSNGVTPQ